MTEVEMRRRTYVECAADANAAGWPAVIPPEQCTADLADVDRLCEAFQRDRAATQTDGAEVPEFKTMTVASRGNETLRRLTLVAMQGVIWQLRQADTHWRLILPAAALIEALLKRKLAVGATPGEAAAYLRDQLWISCSHPEDVQYIVQWFPRLAANAAAFVKAGNALTDEMTSLLGQVRATLLASEYRAADMRRAAEVIAQLLANAAGDGTSSPQPPLPPPLHAGEPWADAALGELEQFEPAPRAAWSELLHHASNCNAAKAGMKWLDRFKVLLEPIGAEAFVGSAGRWLGKLGLKGTAGLQVTRRGQTYNSVPCDASQNVLVGLAWGLSATKSVAAMGILADLAEISFRPIPRFGPRCAKVGGAAVRALASAGTLDAVGQLARLELRVRTPKGRKLIKKVLAEAIVASGLSRQDVEETSVPSFGLRDGRTSLELGDGWVAEIDATNAYEPKLAWRKPDGSVAKSSAVVKKMHPAEVESAQRALKDIEGMLPAQRTRLELLLRDVRTWRFDAWRQRYLDHGLLAPMVRRLIWTVDGTPVVFVDGTPRDVSGRAIEFADSAEVAIWHPVGRSVDEVVVWRKRLEELSVPQPFKQAHREVYLITDAELDTRTYSNRFAAHIVKTPTFIAIGQTRKWSVSLYGEAKLELPQFDLRAEYWAHAAADAGGHEHFNYAYGPAYLATDQVRFYRTGGTEPVPVADIPPLALSEVLRDCDLFVGIASVGADPNWTDGGNARYQAYWMSYSFGDLTESAKTRKAVLERLIPRLKIAPRCELSDKFLRVRGDVRQYKIHLGSGNILMEPNDQYLCIVPARGAAAATNAGEKLFLPFEGDQTLSVILSKAFMLADDTAIADPTIVSQIQR